MDYIFLAAEGGPMNMIFIVAMIAVMYFFLIRPQQQKQKKQDTFVSDMKKGDKVVTTSGIHGKIMEMAEDNGLIVLLIDKNKGVNIQIQKSAISKELSEAFYGGEE
jgi:preprotein translocase subunit YajC